MIRNPVGAARRAGVQIPPSRKYALRDGKMYGIVIWLICSGIEVVITGLTRNRVGQFQGQPRKALISLAFLKFLHFHLVSFLRFFYTFLHFSTHALRNQKRRGSLANSIWRCTQAVEGSALEILRGSGFFVHPFPFVFKGFRGF